MKSIITVIIGILGISYALTAVPTSLSNITTNSEYFICHFSDSVTAFELNELKNQGFLIYESETNSNIVYVKAKTSVVFSSTLKSKMKELILVDKKGNRKYIIETVTEDSPEFLKLFFNFI